MDQNQASRYPTTQASTTDHHNTKPNSLEEQLAVPSKPSFDMAFQSTNGTQANRSGTTETTTTVNDTNLVNSFRQLAIESVGTAAVPSMRSFDLAFRPINSNQQALDLITPFKKAGNTKTNSTSTTGRTGSVFFDKLNNDIRFMVYDLLVDTQHDVIISPKSKNRGPLTALLSTNRKVNEDVNQWLKHRNAPEYKGDTLTHNPTFGIINPKFTLFKFAFSHRVGGIVGETVKFQRCYNSDAAQTFIKHLELWQRAMTLANSIDLKKINEKICYSDHLYGVGPNPRGSALRHTRRILEPDNHSVSTKDFIVVDPNDFSSDVEVDALLKDVYPFQPYVWSKDYDNHEVEQSYSFYHPNGPDVKWVKGLEACGTEAILANSPLSWCRAFGYFESPHLYNEYVLKKPFQCLHKELMEYFQRKERKEEEQQNEELHMRCEDLMDIDNEDSDNEDVMDLDDAIVTGSNEGIDIDLADGDVNMNAEEEPEKPTTTTTTTVTLSESRARRAINRSISMNENTLDEMTTRRAINRSISIQEGQPATLSIEGAQSVMLSMEGSQLAMRKIATMKRQLE